MRSQSVWTRLRSDQIVTICFLPWMHDSDLSFIVTFCLAKWRDYKVKLITKYIIVKKGNLSDGLSHIIRRLSYKMKIVIILVIRRPMFKSEWIWSTTMKQNWQDILCNGARAITYSDKFDKRIDKVQGNFLGGKHLSNGCEMTPRSNAKGRPEGWVETYNASICKDEGSASLV